MKGTSHFTKAEEDLSPLLVTNRLALRRFPGAIAGSIMIESPSGTLSPENAHGMVHAVAAALRRHSQRMSVQAGRIEFTSDWGNIDRWALMAIVTHGVVVVFGNCERLELRYSMSTWFSFCFSALFGTCLAGATVSFPLQSESVLTATVVFLWMTLGLFVPSYLLSMWRISRFVRAALWV